MGELTDRQRAFVAHYVACLNAAEAARRAGYSADTARQIGHENLTKPDIRAAVDAAMAEITMPKAEILGRLTAQARADIGEFFVPRGNGVALDMKRAKAEGLTPLLKKYSRSKEGTITVEMYDAQTALTTLAKHYGLLVDRTEVSGPAGGPIPVREVIIEMPPDEPVDPARTE